VFEDFWFCFIPIGLVALFGVLVVTVCFFEKRRTVPYERVAEEDADEPTRDADKANDEAYREEYVFCGTGRHAGSGVIRVRYDFWLSPDCLTAVVIGGGTTAKVPVFGIWLWSRLEDGTILCTTNEIGEQDISGLVRQQTWPQARFPILVDNHQSRLDEAESPPVPFEKGNPYDGLADLSRRRAQSLVQSGRATYLDEDGTRWKFTLSGALRFYVTGVWVRPFRRLLRALGMVSDP
jgi:hypothetical protein